ncbi:MAG TPA: hypothetical protein VF543_10070 [Pyrinomonadaceae bacterium]
MKSFQKVPFGEFPVQGNHKAVQILDSPHDDERVEVLLEERDGTERVILKYSTWVEGLGWCGQKTINLDGAHLDDLHRALTVARHHINRKRTEAGQITQPATVIQLPTVA